MAIGETFTVRVGTIDVLVTRKRVKNINFRIGSDGVVRMSIPAYVSRAEAERVAQERRAWFEAHLSQVEEHKAERAKTEPQEWRTGEALMVWGKPTPLRVVGADETFVPCELVGDELVIRDGGDRWWRVTAVEQWLERQLVDRINELLPRCVLAISAAPTSLTVRRMKTRWGSCTPSNGRIRMNTALAECPPECTEMVLLHELCHLHVRNHGPEFQALMDLHCPGWRVTQRWLDEHPPRVL